MPKPPRPYARLTRTWSGLGARHSLWSGPDHLLVVSSTGITEHYQRLFLRDIRGIIVTETSRFATVNAVLGCALFLLGVPLAWNLVVGNLWWAYMLIVAVPLAGVLVLHLALGPTCQTRVMTGLQTVRIPVLSRRRRLRAVLAKLTPLIHGAQADLAPPPPAAAAAATPAPRSLAEAAGETAAGAPA